MDSRTHDAEHSHHAIRFAHEFAAKCSGSEWTPLLIDPANNRQEHKVLAPFIPSLAREKEFGDIEYDWEGNSKRKAPQSHSYPILGTWAHPDAAVLRPFKCAIEIDRETDGGLSQFKPKLLKAAVHVMSRAYDSAVFVYILRKSTAKAHEDERGYTNELLHTLRGHGLFVAFVDGSSNPGRPEITAAQSPAP